MADFAITPHLQGDRMGDSLDRQVAGQGVAFLALRLRFGTVERDRGIPVELEKRGAA